MLALGDICGKGLAAGMWISHLVGLIGTRTAATSEPATIVTGVNRDLCRMSSVAPLATLFLAKLDPVDRQTRLLQRRTSSGACCCARTEHWNCFPKVARCWARSRRFVCKGIVELRAGDLLLVCSDGILESAQ